MYPEHDRKTSVGGQSARTGDVEIETFELIVAPELLRLRVTPANAQEGLLYGAVCWLGTYRAVTLLF